MINDPREGQQLLKEFRQIPLNACGLKETERYQSVQLSREETGYKLQVA